MTKSKLIFIVLFIGYIVIAILNAFGILSVGSIVLFGLSLAALLSSLSEAVNGILGVLCQKNQMDFIAKCSIAFIGFKLGLAAPKSTNIADIANIQKNLEDQNPHYLKAVHSSEYWGRKSIKDLRIVMYFLDAGSILSFVVTPFIKNQQADLTDISVFITLCAFGLMCLNVFICELQSDLSRKQFDFYNSTHILINSTYPDFATFLDSQLNHRVSLLTDKKLRAQRENGDSQIENPELPLADLVTVAEFGEPIYPYLKPMDTICNVPDSDLWHKLIKADNYHALQFWNISMPRKWTAFT